LGFGVWAPTPNPQSPIPNPQSPIVYFYTILFINKNNNEKNIDIIYKIIIYYIKKLLL
jgi:hypothetical protein